MCVRRSSGQYDDVGTADTQQMITTGAHISADYCITPCHLSKTLHTTTDYCITLCHFSETVDYNCIISVKLCGLLHNSVSSQ